MMSTVKFTREKLGISQSDMALLLGTTRFRVSDFERGVREETNQMQAHLISLLAIHEHGGIAELIKSIEKEKEA